MADLKDFFIDLNQSDKDGPRDFYFLRQKAMELLEQINDGAWTDYNLHDPGITILEQLCFAMTDLAYRTDFDITDLLTNAKGNIPLKAHSFHFAFEILSSNTYTVNDFRKLLINAFDEVGNAWVEPYVRNHSTAQLKGVYRVVIQPDLLQVRDRLQEGGAFFTELKQKVGKLLSAHRNIDQDFEDIQILKPFYLKVKMQIQIEKSSDVEKLLSEVFVAIENYLNHTIRFYSETELLNMGYALEDIYNGPFLKNGIILDTDLKKRKTVLDSEDLTKFISEVPGVIRVRDLCFISEDKEYKTLKVDDASFPLLERTDSDGYQYKDVVLLMNNFKVFVREEVFNLYSKRNEQARRRHFEDFDPVSHLDASKWGKNRNLQQYFSIQDFFPVNFQLGREGVLSTDSHLRKAQVKQLKAFLFLFEQVLANYLSQLANLESLYSPDMLTNQQKTYFSQPLYAVPGVKDILVDFPIEGGEDKYNIRWEAFQKNAGNGYAKALNQFTESREVFLKRKNDIFDHLLARFNISVDAYPVALYYSLYSDESLIQKQFHQLEWKAKLVKEIPSLTKFCNRGFDYRQDITTAQGYHFTSFIYDLLYIRKKPFERLTAVFDKEGPLRIVEETRSGMTDTTMNIAEEKEKNDLDLFLTKQEADAIATQLGEEESLPLTDTLVFNDKGLGFFTVAIDIDFYKICPSRYPGGQQLVIYRDPLSAQWQIAGKFRDKRTALRAVVQSVRSFKNISIGGEGFHIVEHILLRPPFDSQSFGFRLRDAGSSYTIEHRALRTYAERVQLIEQLRSYVAAICIRPNDLPHIAGIGKQIDDICIIKRKVQADDELPVKLEDDLWVRSTELIRVLTQFLGKITQGNAIDYLFSLNGQDCFDESLLHHHMTVVLPDWPARFQDLKFMEYLKALVTNNSPAPAKIRFVPMDIVSMRAFESTYFEWLELLRSGQDLAQTAFLAEILLKNIIPANP